MFGGCNEPSARLLAGWLTARLKVDVAVLRRDGQQDSFMPFGERTLGELLTEELRRLDHDHVYAEALSTVTGVADLEERSPRRRHIWYDPATHTEARIDHAMEDHGQEAS